MKSFDVIIIGGGPAGISCAMWCSELGLKTILFESLSELGGQLNWTFNPIENHLGTTAINGAELRDRFVRQAAGSSHLTHKNSEVKRVDFSNRKVDLDENESFGYGALVIATGVRRRKLGVRGEDEFKNKGILFSGKRDSDLVSGKRVAIIGGGDAAFENVDILSKHASKVYLIHRSDQFRARQEFIEAAKDNPKLKLITDTSVKGIYGGNMIEYVELINNKSHQTRRLKIEALLLRIGVQPNSELVKSDLEIDSRGYVKVDHLCQASDPDVFAIGDIANPVSPTVSTAVGMGSTATGY